MLVDTRNVENFLNVRTRKRRHDERVVGEGGAENSGDELDRMSREGSELCLRKGDT